MELLYKAVLPAIIALIATLLMLLAIRRYSRALEKIMDYSNGGAWPGRLRRLGADILTHEEWICYSLESSSIETGVLCDLDPSIDINGYSTTAGFMHMHQQFQLEWEQVMNMLHDPQMSRDQRKSYFKDAAERMMLICKAVDDLEVVAMYDKTVKKKSMVYREQAAMADSDAASLALHTKAMREDRFEKFEKEWLPKLGEVTSIEIRKDLYSYEIQSPSLGKLVFYPKSNSVLICKQNNWKRPGLRFLFEHFNLQR